MTSEEPRPLAGRRVLVTRPRAQADEIVARLTALGAEAIVVPLIQIAPPDDPEPLRRAAAHLTAFDWIIFTSANAVDALLGALRGDAAALLDAGRPRICTVGTATADRLARRGVSVDLVPPQFRAEGVVDALAATGSMKGVRVLLPHADIGREIIADRLRAAGAVVTAVVAYRTVAAPPTGIDLPAMLANGQLDAVTFTSASAVRHFVDHVGAEEAGRLLRRTVVAAIGPLTSNAAADAGIGIDVQPSTYTAPAMVDALAAHFSARH